MGSYLMSAIMVPPDLMRDQAQHCADALGCSWVAHYPGWV